MRIALAAIPLLLLGACQVSKDNANGTTSITYNSDLAENAAADVGNTAQNIANDIAIDLGTANTLIIHNDTVVVNEPSIVALDRNNPKNILAVGKKALMMHEKTHESIRTVRPLKDGVIADFNAAEHMIRGMIKMINQGKGWFFPSLRMVICIPSGITEVEKRAVRDSAEIAGAKEVYLIHEPMAAAVGIGIDVEEPMGNMIIDIGGGTTEIAVIALSGIVCDQPIRVAGDNFDSDIVQYIRRQHNIMIGDRTAEKIKIEVGAALPELADPPADFAVQGRDLMTLVECLLHDELARSTGGSQDEELHSISLSLDMGVAATWSSGMAERATPAGQRNEVPH